MKELEILIKTFGEGLRTLAQGVHAIADKLDNYVESPKDDSKYTSEPEPDTGVDIPAEAAEESPAGTGSDQEPAVNATELVYETIATASNPISMDELFDKTGYDRKKLSNILYRLRKQDKIKNVSKGVYASCAP